jgi:hypothetical protein
MLSTSQRDPQITKGMTKVEKMQNCASLKPKARRRYVRCCRHHRPPDRTPDLLIGPLIITIIDPCPCRSIGGRNRNCRGFSTGRPLLLCASSSELSMMIILLSPGGPRMSRLRSAKSFLVNSSSREVSTTSKEGPLTGVAPEALPCSNTDEQRWRDETSDGDPGGGGDPNDTGVGVFASSGRGLPSAKGECSRLTPFLSSIGG